MGTEVFFTEEDFLIVDTADDAPRIAAWRASCSSRDNLGRPFLGVHQDCLAFGIETQTCDDLDNIRNQIRDDIHPFD
jgi:hypothetical protein